MNINKEDMSERISLESILVKIGFVPFGDDYVYDFGNCKLKAFKGLNLRFQDGFNFSGNYFTSRTAGYFDFSLPYVVESYELGIAYLAYNLKGGRFQNIPLWLLEGQHFEDLLPWKKELRAYEENPYASVEHEWFRILVKKLRKIADQATEDDITSFYFDGSLLKVICQAESLTISGQGKAWNEIAYVKTKSLSFLPKKILNQNAGLSIWKGNLHVTNRVFEMIKKE